MLVDKVNLVSVFCVLIHPAGRGADWDPPLGDSVFFPHLLLPATALQWGFGSTLFALQVFTANIVPSTCCWADSPTLPVSNHIEFQTFMSVVSSPSVVDDLQGRAINERPSSVAR